ncbi:hypothetical protein H2200_002556 [Cladophialophora chaetospira]|uniref:Uncharacterized protein n=1 Tax=Cladophialophora chaetospira TaxID=386627 RepID=A0AA39CNN8_9EURO|nr:hypothetical protein H2200_002556 [Cladophialophora chaetospira]
MGANTSKVDADLALGPGEFDASSTGRIPGTSSYQASAEATPVSSDQGSIRTTVTSSVHSSSSATSPTSALRSTRTALATLRREPMMAAARSKAPSPTLPSFPTHKRPLPPPESRETIRSQAAKVAGWKIIDESDEIYESCQINDSARLDTVAGPLATCDTATRFSAYDTKPTLEEPSVVRITIRSSLSPDPDEPDYNVPPTISMLPLAEARSLSPEPKPAKLSRHLRSPFVGFNVDKTKPPVAAESRKRKPSAAPDPKKKRRLILTPRAIEITSESAEAFDDMDDSVESSSGTPAKKSEFGFVNPFPDGFPLTAEEEWLLPDAHPGSCLYQDSDHEDEGYWSQIVSASDQIEGESAEERDERRMKLLERLYSPPLKPPQAEKETPEALLLKQARELMLKEQEAGAERSRRLREKALRRRGLLPEVGSSASPEHEKIFSDTGGDDSPMTDVFSDKDGDVQMEELLDMAQEGPTKDAKPAQSTFKTYRPQGGLNRVIPASRVAADQYQTQNRHLMNEDHKPRTPINQYKALSSTSLPESHPPSQDANLEEREQRLREAKQLVPAEFASSGRRVSSPALGNELARGDIATRNLTHHLKKPPQNSPADRTLLDQGRHERGSGVGPRPRSLIDRISSYRNVDEDYDEVDNISSSGGDNGRSHAVSSRPLSGFELLAAKARAAEGHQHDIKPFTRPISRQELLSGDRQVQAVGNRGDYGDDSLSMTEPGSGNSSTISPQDTSVEDLNEDMEGAAASRFRPGSEIQMLPVRNNSSRDAFGNATIGSLRRPAFAPASSQRQETRGLTLPKNFDMLPEDEKETVVQHEIAKERQRDLEAIGTVFWDTSHLLCYTNRDLSDRVMQTETDELKEIGRFIALVIDQNRSGKAARKRIQDISGNIKRRIDKAGRYAQQPTDGAIMLEMRRTFRLEHIDFVDSEVKKIKEIVRRYGETRRSSKYTRKDSRRRPSLKRDSEYSGSGTKQVRFEVEEVPDVEDFNASRSSKTSKRPKTPKRTGTATENRRQAQYDSQDRAAEKLRELLKKFDTADSDQIADLQTQVSETEAELARSQDHEDSESEEEGGADYVFGAGRAASQSQPDQDIREINRLEDARQKEAGTHFSQRAVVVDQPAPRQAFDPELLRQMQLKKLRDEEAKNDPNIIQDKEAAIEADSDSDSDSETVVASDDEDYEQQVFKYTVYATFRGVAGYEDADHYQVKGYYDYDLAERKVLEIIAGIYSSLPRGTVVDARNWSCNTTVRDGLMEQHIMLGEDVEHEARVWVEKDAVDLDKRRFRQAKRQRAVVERFNYKVYWQKKVMAVVEEVEDATETTGKATTKVATKPGFRAEYEGYEALFGTPTPSPEPEEHTKAPETIITEISRDEIDEHTFSSSAWANRDAKNIFLQWFHGFLPGLANEGYRRLEAESMELYLEELGDWGLFDRTESLRGIESDEHGMERKVEETFRVWVKKVAVKGPGN